MPSEDYKYYINKYNRILFLKYSKKNNTKKVHTSTWGGKSLFIIQVVGSDLKINFTKDKNGDAGPIKVIFTKRNFNRNTDPHSLNSNCCELGIINKPLSSSFSLQFTQDVKITVN